MRYCAVSVNEDGVARVIDGDASIRAQRLGGILSGRTLVHNAVYVIGVSDAAALGAALHDRTLAVESLRDENVQFVEAIGTPDHAVTFEKLVSLAAERIQQLEATHGNK